MTTTASEVYADVVLLYELNIFQSRTFLIKIYIFKNNIMTCSCWASVESRLLWRYASRSSLQYSGFRYTIELPLQPYKIQLYTFLVPRLVRPRCKVAPILTLNAPVATKVVCFSRLLKFLRSLYGKQWTQIRGAVCSGSTLFASILRFVSNVRQLFTADDIFRCIFSWRFKG